MLVCVKIISRFVLFFSKTEIGVFEYINYRKQITHIYFTKTKNV